MTNKDDGVSNAVRAAVRDSDAALRMSELNCAVSVSSDDDVFVEVGIDKDRARRTTAHVATAAVDGVLRATDPDGVAHSSSGGFAEQATDGEKVVSIVSDRIYRIEVEDDWRGLPAPKLSARIMSSVEAI